MMLALVADQEQFFIYKCGITEMSGINMVDMLNSWVWLSIMNN